jgi:hypothetical protein
MIDVESAMRTVNPKRINGYITAMEKIQKYYNDASEEILRALREYILIHLNVVLVHDVYGIKNITFFGKHKKMREVVSVEIFKETLAQTSLFQCCSLQLLPEAFMKMHLWSLGGIMCYAKAVSNDRKQLKSSKKSSLILKQNQER